LTPTSWFVLLPFQMLEPLHVWRDGRDGTRMEQGWNKDGTRMEQGWKDGFNSEQDVNTMDRFDSRICAVVQTCSEPSSPRPILLTGHFSASYEYSKLKEIALCAAFARSTLESRRLDRLT
jgi:hypothetical protein